MADSTLFIMCATALAVLDVSKCIENGIAIDPVHENTTGTIRFVCIIQSRIKLNAFISHPKPFRCSIKPRSEKSVALIQSEDLH
jgi:hypothetical protein